jgi:misacylated tRNA(Ala) deacylase
MPSFFPELRGSGQQGTEMMAAATIVGALSCQRESYLRTLETEVVSCSEFVPSQAPPQRNNKAKKSKDGKDSCNGAPNGNPNGTAESKTYLLEFADSVLFPEGGGQPTDHGTITPLSSDNDFQIPITNLQRQALRCLAHSPVPLTPGTKVKQEVDWNRRWDHMQQHTGQHLLSAIFDTLSLETLSWSMGSAGEMNYLELPRKPTEAELQLVQQKCTEAIRSSLPITVEETREHEGDSLPDDYDKDQGIIRIINIAGLDRNPCCGTHLKTTAHISLILLHHMQTIRGTNCRLFFSCGDRAIALASSSINALRAIGGQLSSGSKPGEVQDAVQRLGDALSESRKREKKVLGEIAGFEAERIKTDLKAGRSAFCHRPSEGLEFINSVVFEVKGAVVEAGRAVVLVTGEEKGSGAIMVVGEEKEVERLVGKVKETVSSVKGGGKGGKWQGKVVAWGKGEVERLREAVAETGAA